MIVLLKGQFSLMFSSQKRELPVYFLYFPEYIFFSSSNNFQSPVMRSRPKNDYGTVLRDGIRWAILSDGSEADVQ